MIIYSIVPIEIIMQDTGGSDNVNYVEMEYLGEIVQAIPISNSSYMINRLISTSPSAFLKSGLQPGTIITRK